MEYTCTDCTLTFSKHSNLRSHLKKFHPDKLDVTAPNKTFKCVAMCNKCSKSFSKYSNLKRHVTKFHPENVNELASPKIYPYQCSECQKNFSHLHNLRSHQKMHVRDIIDIEKKQRVLKCSLCDYTHALKSNLIRHFEEYHKIKIKRQDLHFSSELEFQKWRTDWEKQNYSSYVTYSHPYTTTEGIKKTTYICHRSGFYVKKGHDMRHIKTQGTKKINGICPSQLKVSMLLENGTVKVNFIQTHIGHDNDLGHLNITDNEKMEIASKIASKIPFASILDDVRDSVTNNKLARMHLLTRKDLHNISQSFELNSERIRHKNKSNLNPDRTAKQLEIEKQKLILLQTQMIQNISSFEQLEAFKNITAPLEPTLRALAVHTGNQERTIESSHGTENIPYNKRIVPQKRLFSTKKNSKKPRKNLLSKPEPIDTNLITYQLLIAKNNNNNN